MRGFLYINGRVQPDLADRFSNVGRFKILTGAIASDPLVTAIVAGAASLDVQERNTHVLSELVEATAITLTGGEDGDQGLVVVRQDAGGANAVTWVVAGRTVVGVEGGDTDAGQTGDQVTIFAYFFFTVDAVALVSITKLALEP